MEDEDGYLKSVPQLLEKEEYSKLYKVQKETMEYASAYVTSPLSENPEMTIEEEVSSSFFVNHKSSETVEESNTENPGKIYST